MLQLGVSFTDAYFETMSGPGLHRVDHPGQHRLASINLWQQRHPLVLARRHGADRKAIAVLPLLGIGGCAMFKAETQGPMKDSKMTPASRRRRSGVGPFISRRHALPAFRLPLGRHAFQFDAVCHAFSTMGLGGFSTHDASFGHFDSPTLELIAVVFMRAIAGELHDALAPGAPLGDACVKDPEAPWFSVTLSSLIVKRRSSRRSRGDSPAPFAVQRRLDCHDDRLRQCRPRAMADVRAALDAFPVRFRDQCRLDGRW